MEHRYGNRRPLSTPAVIQTAQGLSIKATLHNVSASGALLHCALKVPLYTQISVYLPAVAHVRAGILAQVVRHAEGGLGVEWIEFAPKLVQRLLSPQVLSPSQKSPLPSAVR